MSSPPAALVRAFSENVPHNRDLGMVVVELGDGRARFELPWAEALVGDPATGALHGGVLTALLDAASGAAVFAALPRLAPIATLELRLDHVRPSVAGRAVRAEASCYAVADDVAYTRAVAFHDDPAAPVAAAVGTFVISPPRAPAAGSPA